MIIYTLRKPCNLLVSKRAKFNNKYYKPMSIWKFKEIKKQLNENSDYITLGEGETRVDEILLEKKKILLKREDLNPTGSWKDRGTAFKLTELINNGKKEAVISSSGNAAISFLTYANFIKKFKLHIVVSPNTNLTKLKKIKSLVENTNHELYLTNNTRRKSIEISAVLKIPNLRASIDENIVRGYWSLGFELSKLIKEHDNNKNTALFIPVSSGTTLIGIVQGLFTRLEQEYRMPRIFICQTQSVHPLIEENTSYSFNVSEKSLADSIFDNIVLRKPQIYKLTRETNGEIFAITNNELLVAQKIMNETNIVNLSYTSLLSIAGFLRVKENFAKNICITSGT